MGYPPDPELHYEFQQNRDDDERPSPDRHRKPAINRMSGQSEAEWLNANVITHGQESADWVAWARGEIRALQAQVEQLQKALEEDTKLFQGRWEASERREAALRTKLSVAEAYIPSKDFEDYQGDCALSEQSESEHV